MRPNEHEPSDRRHGGEPTGRNWPSGSPGPSRDGGGIAAAAGAVPLPLSAQTELVHGFLDPCFCVIAQGAKELTLGEDSSGTTRALLLATVGLPAMSRVVEASPERPYLGLRLTSTRPSSRRSWWSRGFRHRGRTASVRAVDVSPLDADLLDATVRLVRLIDAPARLPRARAAGRCGRSCTGC